MNILFLNNYYYIRGGSERVFHSEINLMRHKGLNVEAFCRSHPLDPEYEGARFFPDDINTQEIRFSINGIKTIFELFYSNNAKRSVSRYLGSNHVDIVHGHNIYGRLTSSVLDEFKNRNIPVVITLHDYKFICPNYKLENNGIICEECKGHRFYCAIRNRCHKDSILASFIYSAESYFNYFKKSYTNKVYKLISPSHFLRDKFIEFGWDANHIEVIPNFIDTTLFEPHFKRGAYFLYLGRLSNEKGVATLLEAFTGLPPGMQLVVAGTGPLEESLKSWCGNDSGVSFTGHLSGDRLKRTIQDSLAIVIPSEWYENAPMSVLEALAYGKPVIGSKIGGIPEMVRDGDTGFLFEPGNVEDLRDKMLHIISLSNQKIENIGREARSFVETNHSTELHYEKLMAVYNLALNGYNR